MGCHCEKCEPPTLAAHARGALPLVRAAWGVTARKASHNASNAKVVVAGKMGCNSSRDNWKSDYFELVTFTLNLTLWIT